MPVKTNYGKLSCKPKNQGLKQQLLVVEEHHFNQIYGDHYANKALQELQVNEAVTSPPHFYRRTH